MSNKHEFENSTSIRHCDYDDDSGHMEIHFVSGSTYRYKCDKSVYEGLKAAESPGKHFHMNIRKQHKPVTK